MSRARGRRFALLALTLVVLGALVAGFVARIDILTAWHIHRLESGDDATKIDAARRLAELRSEAGARALFEEVLTRHDFTMSRVERGLFVNVRHVTVNADDELPGAVFVDAIIAIGRPAVRPLAEMLRADSIETQSVASELLQRIGAPAALALAEILSEGDPVAGSFAAAALRAMGAEALPALPELVRALQSGEPEFIEPIAADALSGLGPPGVAALAVALDEPRTAVRLAAARALHEGQQLRDLPADVIVRLLEDENCEVAARAIQAVRVRARDCAERAIPILSGQIGKTCEQVSGYGRLVSGALSALAPHAPAVLLRQAEATQEPLARLQLALPLVAALEGPEESRELVSRTLAEAQPEEYGRLAAELFSTLERRSVPFFAESLAAADEWKRGTAVTMIGRIGAYAAAAVAEYVPRLEEAVDDASATVRVEALQALNTIRCTALNELLLVAGAGETLDLDLGAEDDAKLDLDLDVLELDDLDVTAGDDVTTVSDDDLTALRALLPQKLRSELDVEAVLPIVQRILASMSPTDPVARTVRACFGLQPDERDEPDAPDPAAE